MQELNNIFFRKTDKAVMETRKKMQYIFEHKKYHMLLIYQEKHLQLLKRSPEKYHIRKKINTKELTQFFSPKLLKTSILGLA